MNIKRILGAGLTVGGIGIAVVACQASADISASAGPDVSGCNADSTVDCSGGGWGYSCDPGTNPEDVDSTLSCSTPTADPSGGDDYCCFSWNQASGSSCNPDDSLTAACPDPDSYGYVCAAAGDDPTSLDSSLNCSTGVPDADGTSTDFCCNYGEAYGGGGYPSGCSPDSSVNCSGSGADGYSCAAGDTPENYDNLVCSDPTPDGSNDDFCCFAGGSSFSTTTCNPDDDITGFCDPGSYGFQCAIGDDPSSYDNTLNCSTNQTDADGVHDDYCCTY